MMHPICEVYGCENLADVIKDDKFRKSRWVREYQGGIWGWICKECQKKHCRAAHPSRKYRKDYCENVDGRLGHVCTTTIVDADCQIDVDHIDGNPHNNVEDNFQSLCKSCHAYKTKINKDHLSPGKMNISNSFMLSKKQKYNLIYQHFYGIFSEYEKVLLNPLMDRKAIVEIHRVMKLHRIDCNDREDFNESLRAYIDAYRNVKIERFKTPRYFKDRKIECDFKKEQDFYDFSDIDECEKLCKKYNRQVQHKIVKSFVWQA